MADSKPSNWLTRAQDWLWHPNLSRLPGPGRLGIRIARVAFAVIKDLAQGYTNLHAMSLVYTTLLSIVPFLALSFSVLKGFGVHNQLEPLLQNLLMAPLGERSQEITSNVLNFVDNIRVGVLGAVGLGILVYTVISLVQKVERAFNQVWRVSQIRPLAQRFSNYLSVILIGPLLAFSTLGATAALVSSDTVGSLLSVAPLGWVFGLLSRLAPYAVIIILFTFLYFFIPNTRVKIRHAFIGGAVAGFMWQSLGYLFTLFVTSSTQYTAIYSGFAVGILLLVWIYLSWLVLLTGATVAYYSQNFRFIRQRQNVLPSAETDEAVGLTLMYRIAWRFDRQKAGIRAITLSTELNADATVIDRLINKLLQSQLIVRSEDHLLTPARPLDQITLAELLHVIRAADSALAMPPYTATLQARVKRALETALDNETLEDWVRQSDEPVTD
ncbi:YihY/virulence factor BrkB family protein [Saccharospirillum impatiens]|uniref:YihY/virulence factor BrkB family protein n=1 Tax=Saccharospirillum impatiens TaxID=169438 RepID=UPI0003F783BA|nr:YihY/virulence factor BrkB family protein [Saccharospirillum impatiens]